MFINYINVDSAYQKLKNEEKYLIYAGRISAEKGIEELIKKFFRCPTYRCSIKNSWRWSV